MPREPVQKQVIIIIIIFTRVTCLCSKSCKILKGLKIHQTKMGCTRRRPVEQRTKAVSSTVPGEAVEEQDQEPFHSIHLNIIVSCGQLHARRVSGASLMIRDQTALDATSRGTVDLRLQMMCTLIISIDAKRFGLKQSKAKLARDEDHPA